MDEELKNRLAERCPSLTLKPLEPMSRNTSFRIGGPVALMAVPRSEEEALCAVRTAAELGIRPAFMGNGTNLLVADGGADVFLIRTFEGLEELELTGSCEITAGSGVLLSALAAFAQKNGLTGLEFAQGIPGTLGGAITMNAGAYGGEISQVVTRTEYLTPEGVKAELTGAEHDFSYRHSAFSGGGELILRAVLTLRSGDPEAIRRKMDDLRARRKASQPLEYPSAGSMFKRPAKGYAAALIDECGLKGFTVGGAQVSEKHAGFVINRGGATCADVLKLVAEVQRQVKERTGTELQMEVRTLGV